MPTTPASPRAVDDGTAILEIIDRRLIEPHYQPIVDLSSTGVVGLEALARGPAGTDLRYPDRLLAAASAAGRLGEFDMLCAERALEGALEAATPPPLLFVNVEPAVMNQVVSPRLVELIGAGLPFHEVMEFTERALTMAPGAMVRLAGVMRAFGHSIALDDVGVDPLSLVLFPILEPEIIKLDMSLVRDPHAAATARIAAAVREQAQRTGARIIAEGIETQDDFTQAVRLGAHWGQGWLFGRPAPIQHAHHRYDRDAAAALPRSRAEFLDPVITPFEATAAHAPAVAATVQDILDHLDRIRALVAHDPDTIVLASVPDDMIAGLPGPVHTLFGDPRSLIVNDEPIPGEFCVAALGNGSGLGMCVRSRPHQQIRRLDQLAAVAEVARNLLLRHPYTFPPHDYAAVAPGDTRRHRG
ncbi:EAL domain-containing protein [Actinoplanes subglobosus]|uniref:EAL domain-containing protein n=1 Tax=Actinoplanes subglobosus TaxID=1547892 RepID=A0ABV8INJ8_9ACTN